MLHLPRDGQSSPECAKGRDEVPAPRPIYRLDAAYARATGGRLGSARGRRSSKRAPRPGGTGSARTSSPPWPLASWRAMYRPRPTPPARRVAPESSWVKRSKMRSRSAQPGRQQQLLDQLLEPGALADGHVHELAPLVRVEG